MADLTFLMNADPPGATNQFYGLAKQYFVAAGSTVIDAPAIGQTLEGVFKKLKELNTEQKTINLVSHASAFAAMECPVTVAEQNKGRRTMTADDLQDVLAAKSLAPPGPAVITKKTRVVIYGCDVGRSENFLKMLSGLFGDPGELLGPRRLSVFQLVGTKVKYRQAQTWTLVRKAALIPAGASAPTGGWPAFRTAFVKDVAEKFARVAILAEIGGEEHLKTILTTVASNATTKLGPTFFFEEGIDIIPDAGQTPAEALASVKPRSNGDPVTAAPASIFHVDDTSLVTTISKADAFPTNPQKTKFAIRLVLLAQMIDADVLIGEGPGYRRVSTHKGLGPSPGPKPTGGGGGGGGGGSPTSETEAFNEDLKTFTDALLADGAAQAEIDAMLAEVPQGDATEGIETDIPDATPVEDELDTSVPPEEQA